MSHYLLYRYHHPVESTSSTANSFEFENLWFSVFKCINFSKFSSSLAEMSQEIRSFHATTRVVCVLYV